MNRLFAICFLLFAVYSVAMGDLFAAESKDLVSLRYPIEAFSRNTAYGDKFPSFENEAKKNNIRYKKMTGLNGVRSGYYIIAGVFGSVENQQNAVKKLQEKGFGSGFIINSKTKLFYVYLKHYANWQLAITDCASKFNGSYIENTWILEVLEGGLKETSVLGKLTTETSSAILETGKPNLPLDRSSQLVSKGDPKKNKLLEKANTYFQKMWYAEAAQLYEEALKGNQVELSRTVLQKVGDAHYFNANMERAHYWYTMLYEKFEDEMTAENIFKYAHSVKGMGKYAKAKRLMRLYDRKTGTKTLQENAQTENSPLQEILLENMPPKTDRININNLSVNSTYSDFSPAFYNPHELVFSSARDSLFLTTNRYKWNNQPYLDLYVGKINEESQDVKDALKFSKKINSKYHEASVTFSPDNTTMYFTRNNYGKKLRRDKNGDNNLKIYTSQKVNGDWTEAIELPFNSDDYSTGHPALSPDGKKLYFVSDMPGSLGMTDIFVVDIMEDGTYSQPKNLGPDVNTAQREMFPFIGKDKLYFSSDGHNGFGGLDVYESTYSSETGFSKPANLGNPINSNKDDFSYIVDEMKQKGFFASNRDGGKGDDDIYSFQRLLPEETATNAIAGVITALDTGDRIPVALISLLDGNNIKLRQLYSHEDGSFVFEDLEGNAKYSLQVAAEGFDTAALSTETNENETVTENVALRALHEKIIVEEGIRKFKTENILFDFDQSYIKNKASIELDKLVLAMQDNPGMVIKIEAHTDSRGNKDYNKYLSDTRAKSTKDYLVAKGIDPSRIESAVGYGEERLLNGCDGSTRCTEAQHLLNRRSEFIIVSM